LYFCSRVGEADGAKAQDMATGLIVERAG
jgi:hypothetical protein